MKKIVSFILFCLFFQTSLGQNFSLELNATSENETKIIDSLHYQKDFSKLEDVKKEVQTILEKLKKKGFLSVHFTEKTIEKKQLYQLNLGKQYVFTIINLGNNAALLESKDAIIKIKTEEVENYLNQCVKKLDLKGYPLSKIALQNISLNKDIEADLTISNETQRKYNDIVVLGYDKFPKGVLENLKRSNKKKLFSTQNTEKIHTQIKQFRFLKPIKYPEILFTQDSTKLYIYTQKVKANTFDGYIGFTNNDQQKVIFNGYIDVNFLNLLNSAEKVSLYWKSNGNNQKSFNLLVELPYVFKSPIGIKTQLNITKQDSTFQNAKTNFDIGYYFDYNKKIFLGYQKQESSDIKNTNTTNLTDYISTFATIDFDYTKHNFNQPLLNETSHYSLKFGSGKRVGKRDTNNQYFASLQLQQLVTLNAKNLVLLKTSNYFLQSSKYLTNELFRFGGINSIRGFNENVLQGNLFSSLITEYRYVTSSNLYLHTIIDYGYFQDQTIAKKGNLLGLGFGFGLLTKNGLFNLVFANGSTDNQAIKFSNSIVQISLKTVF